MARKIDTAETQEIVLRSKRKIVIQEWGYMAFSKAIGAIRKIVSKIRQHGDLNDLFTDFWQAADEGKTEEDRKLNVQKLMQVLEIILSVVGDDPEPLNNIILLSIRDDEGKKFTDADLEGWMLDDVIPVLKAIYTVNFPKLKKALESAGLVADEASQKASKNSQTEGMKPSLTPVTN